MVNLVNFKKIYKVLLLNFSYFANRITKNPFTFKIHEFLIIYIDLKIIFIRMAKSGAKSIILHGKVL